jgi:hypothetical protein
MYDVAKFRVRKSQVTLSGRQSEDGFRRQSCVGPTLSRQEC